jgi:hypothetical protein
MLLYFWHSARLWGPAPQLQHQWSRDIWEAGLAVQAAYQKLCFQLALVQWSARMDGAGVLPKLMLNDGGPCTIVACFGWFSAML